MAQNLDKYLDSSEDVLSKYEDKSIIAKPPPPEKKPEIKAKIGSASATGNKLRILNYLTQQADNPIAQFARKVGSDLAGFFGADENLSGPQPESAFKRNPLTEFLAGASESAGEVGALLTSPQNIALTGTGAQAIKYGSQGAKAASRLLSVPVVGEGVINTLGPGRSIEERGLGAAQVAGGLTGMVFPRGRMPEVPIVEPPVGTRKGPRQLESGTIHVNPKGEAGVPIIPRRSMRESLKEDSLKTYEVAPEGKVTEVKVKKTAQDYIDAVRNKEIDPKETSFDQFRNLDDMRDFEEPSFAKVIEFDPYKKKVEEIIKVTRLDDAEDNIRNLEQELDWLKLHEPKNFDSLEETQTYLDYAKEHFDNLKKGKGTIYEPSFARTSEGNLKIGADIESLGKVLGSSLYEGSIGKIVTKELLQNSFDATKTLDSNANIDVILGNPANNQFFTQVRDNGKGMTRRELETVFSDLGSSGKRDDPNAAGGFGLAKAAPLLGGKKVKVQSIVLEPDGNYYAHEFEGTPDQLLREGVKIKTTKLDVREGDTVNTGTDVKTYWDSESDNHYDSNRFVENIANNSPGFKGRIRVYRQYGDESSRLGEPDLVQTYEGLGNTEWDVVPLESDFATTEIMTPKNATYKESDIVYGMLNQGLFQGVKRHTYEKSPGVPDRILVNIKSKIPEGHPNYPFTANRESLRGFVQQQVSKYLDENIVNPGQRRRQAEIQRVYDEMPQIDVGPRLGTRPFYFYDEGRRLTPVETAQIINDPIFKNIARIVGDIIEAGVTTSKHAGEWENKLERVGISFDSQSYGVNIPNPSNKGKYTIFIDPFAMMTSGTPDQASSGIVHTILHELSHLAVREEGAPFTTALAINHLDFGAKNYMEATNAIHKAITGGRSINEPFTFGEQNRGYSPEVSSFLQRYTESRGREATYKDPLYGTGSKSKTSRKGSGGNDDNPRSSSGRTAGAVGKLKTALASAIPLRQEQQNIYHREKGKRFAAFERVKTKGQKGFRERMGKLKGEYEKVEAAPLELDGKETDTLFNAIMFSKKLTPGEKARGGTALAKLINGDAVPQKGELAILDHVFGGGFAAEILQLHGGLGAANIRLGKTANTMKSLMASVDLSAPFRQGIGLVTRKEFWGAFKEMFNYAASHEAFTNLNQWIEDRPTYLIGRKAGLFLSDTAMGQREEAFLNSYLHDLYEAGPVGKALTTPFRASERAYVGFLNKLRADTFDNMLKAAIEAGHNPIQIAPAIAKYVNVSTGRGNLGRLSKAGDELNMLFFSPRLISSRLTILNPKYYYDAPPFIRKEALRTLLGVAGFIGMANGIGQFALGADLESDPRTSDFGKLQFGNTRLDPGGGFLQYITLAGRIAMQATKSSTTDRVIPYNSGPMSGNTWSQIFGDSRRQGFIESKLSPAAGLIDAVLRQQDFEGNPLNPGKEVMNRFTPIIIQDAIELAKDNPEYLPLLVPTVFGMGTSTYKPRATTSRGGMRAPSIGNLRP